MVRSIYLKVKSIISVFFLLIGSLCFVYALPPSKSPVSAIPAPVIVSHPDTIEYTALYDSLHLDSLELTRQAFEYALQGYRNLQATGSLQHTGILSIVDFSLP